MPGLEYLVQDDFAAGAQRAVAPHLIDEDGAFSLQDFLLGDDDGSIFKRGGSVNVANADFGTSLRFVWNGYLQGGRRTVIASEADFGVISVDEATPLNLGGSGYTLPKRAAELGGVLYLADGTLYGGSRKTADYSTGTVTATLGSKTITGAGTLWTANVDAGMLLRVAGTGRVYVVASVDSNTQITLRDAYEGATLGGQAYALTRLFTASAPYKSSGVMAVVANRLIVCIGNAVWHSEPLKGHDFTATIEPGGATVDNVHYLDGGVQILGAAAVGPDQLLVFTTEGVTAIDNLSLNIVDNYGTPQRRIDQLSGEIILWGNAGIASHRQAAIVPAQDGVYLMDGTGEPDLVSKTISPLYREYVRLGYVPGLAFVHNEHYFLPVLDVTGSPVDLLCCRLDRPYRSREQTYWPWSTITEPITAGASRASSGAGEAPKLLAAASDGRLIDCSGYFTPNAGNAYDHDGVLYPQPEIVTRDYSIANGAIGRARRARLLHELEEVDAGDNPTVSLEVGTGARVPNAPRWDEVSWDDFEWAGEDEAEFELVEEPYGPAVPNTLADQALAQNAWVWSFVVRSRYLRCRLRLSGPAARLVIRRLEIGVPPLGGARHSKVA